MDQLCVEARARLIWARVDDHSNSMCGFSPWSIRGISPMGQRCDVPIEISKHEVRSQTMSTIRCEHKVLQNYPILKAVCAFELQPLARQPANLLNFNHLIIILTSNHFQKKLKMQVYIVIVSILDALLTKVLVDNSGTRQPLGRTHGTFLTSIPYKHICACMLC